jgi:prephenate dehydratase
MTSVAIQGIKGSYSEEAALGLLGDAAEIVECSTFEETFDRLRTKAVELVVVPVENRIVGEIQSTTRLLKQSGARVVDELPLQVRHVLVGSKDANFEDLITIRSHIEALKQCRQFFARHPDIVQIIGADTASSVRRIVEKNDQTHGAIGSRRAAEMYGARILKENIADDIENWTKFYLIRN